MPTLKPLTLEDKSIIEKYLCENHSTSYEYSFVDLYIWRNICDIKYTILNNTLIIQKNEEGKGTFFMKPIGYEKYQLKEIVDELRDNNSDNNSILFGDIEKDFIDDLKKELPYPLKTTADTEGFEYLYDTQALIDLKGKKYHTKRNHCNAFERNYNYEIKEITSHDIITDCINLFDKWQQNKSLSSRNLILERDLIIDILTNINTLNLKSIALYVDEEIVGFTIGELLSENMGVIHIEKANTDYIGVYSFLNREFLKFAFSNTKIINRQEDCGDEGLKKAKEGYKPTRKLEKYLISIE